MYRRLRSRRRNRPLGLTAERMRPREATDRCLRSQPTSGFKGMVKAMKKVALSEVKDDLSKYVRMAEQEAILITRHGKPAGVLVGFASEEDWFDYRLENDPRFLERIEQARQSLRSGKGVKLEDLDGGN